MTSCFLSPNPNSRGERTAVIRMIPGSGWCKTSLFKQLDRYNLWWGICFFFPLHGQLIRPPFNFSASYVCYSDLSETFRVINPSPVACGQRTLPEKTLLVPFGWRFGAEDSRSVVVWIKRGGSTVTCKGAVVRRSLCWDLIWLPGFNADESSRSSEVRRRAGGEWHELPRFWGENKYLAFLRGVGHIAQEFDCPSEYAFGDIYPLRRKEKKTLDFSGFGYGLWGVGCLHIARTFEFSVNPVEHNMGKYDKWEDSVLLTLGASSRTGVPSAR